MLRRCALLLAVTACGHAAAPAHHPVAQKPAARPAPASAVLTPGHVLEAVTTRYLPNLRRCYQQQIKQDPRLRGRMTLSFTIDGRGHVTDATAKGLAPKLGACIERRMLAWTFAAPRTADGTPTEASFRIPLRLDVL